MVDSKPPDHRFVIDTSRAAQSGRRKYHCKLDLDGSHDTDTLAVKRLPTADMVMLRNILAIAHPNEFILSAKLNTGFSS
jgi:hypothetical protein